MRRTVTTVSSVTAEEMRRVVAALADDLPPPEDIKPPAPGTTRCVFAVDTGEPAFVNLPCRGNRIECEKTGGMSFAAACCPDKCNFYNDGELKK